MSSSQYLEPCQAGAVQPAPYDLKLAGAIEEVFGSGRHSLPGLLDGLNDLGIAAPDGEPWTEATLVAELQRLGA